ncbi:hypothetical protein J6590_017126 [Homalodisca vitripennis]|nr:hypothetical protein J6590_017126 [Homalodisca vitripennis]
MLNIMIISLGQIWSAKAPPCSPLPHQLIDGRSLRTHAHALIARLSPTTDQGLGTAFNFEYNGVAFHRVYLGISEIPLMDSWAAAYSE